MPTVPAASETAETGETAGKVAAALERLAQVHRVLAQQAATEHKLSPIQTRILLALRARPDRWHPSQLATDLGVTRATVADALATLRTKHLLTRTPDDTDRRRSRAALSSAGDGTAQQLASWQGPVLRRVAALPADGQGQLLAGLLELIAGLQADGLVPHQRMCLTCRFFRPADPTKGETRHYCNLMQSPLAPPQLRIDCPEHEETA